MKCPECGKREKVEISSVEGYAQDIRECGFCGAIWTFKDGSRVVVKSAKVKAAEKAYSFPPVLDHTKFSSTEDEILAEDQKVWFS